MKNLFQPLLIVFVMLLGSMSAYAHQITIEDLKLIKEFAHDLEKESKKLHDQVELIIATPTQNDEELIEQLHLFEKSAKRFHMDVESHYSQPMLTRNKFFELMTQYNIVSRTIEEFNIYSQVENQYLGILSLVESINIYYNFWNYIQIKEIAHHINKVSSKIYRAIDSDLTGGRTSHERGALRALNNFTLASHDFHNGVEDNFSSPENTRVTLAQLLDSHFDAEFELDYISVSPLLMNAFIDLKVDLRKLQEIYKWNWYL